MFRHLLSLSLPLLGLAEPVIARQRSVAPEQAPAAWVAYAETVNAQVIAWLGAEDEGAVRLRAYLDGTRPAPDQPTAPFVLRLWITPDGTIDRTEFPAFAEPQADADLRALLLGRAIGTPPPPGMLLPLRLELSLAPDPAEPAPTN